MSGRTAGVFAGVLFVLVSVPGSAAGSCAGAIVVSSAGLGFDFSAAEEGGGAGVASTGNFKRCARIL